MRSHAGYERFPEGFFGRADEGDDSRFYGPIRLVNHIDDAAITAVGELYEEMKIDGKVLDLMSSWVSHFRTKPEHLSVLGMNWTELESNPMADATVAHDLNRDPTLPYADNTFDDVVCAVSVDYLTQPLETFVEAARVLRPGGRLVCTFSNRCFPTKVIRGWLALNEQQRCHLVGSYFELAGGFEPPTIEDRSPGPGSDPLYAVWAAVASQP